MKKKWLIYDVDNQEEIASLRNKMGIDKITAQMLWRRGVQSLEEAHQFFNPKLEHLHNPFLMKDMDCAVNRLIQAIDEQQKVIIYGDYDVDGTTSVAMMYSYLKSHIKNLSYYIPDRYDEGYGLSEKAINFATENEVDLVITLDCGIRAVENIALGKKNGIDFIVCDHHTPGEVLPDAIVLDPKRKDCNYPYKELCGCGVGFKLLSALVDKKGLSKETLYDYLDFVSIAIGADIVPIIGENRTLCSVGLEKLNSNPRLGIAKLLELAKRPVPLTLTDVVFVIAPRINAAGRMLHAKEAVELLITRDHNYATELAEKIQGANSDRKTTDEEVKNEALAMLNSDPQHKNRCTNVVFGKGWHKGVIGIVASRIIEEYYRPTVVFSQPEEGELLTASARSAGNVNIYDVLNNCAELFEKFGGHAHAAGLSIKEENYEAFKTKFDDEVRKVIEEETLIPQEKIECEILFNEIFKPGDAMNGEPNLKKMLNRFEPHGPGNMKPVFVSKNVYITDFRVLKEVHLKFSFKQTDSDVRIDAICFNRPDLINLAQKGATVQIAYTIETNEWKNQKRIQLNIKDMRPENVVEYAN
jgi:single-stranded-DNA-specific exonuclease